MKTYQTPEISLESLKITDILTNSATTFTPGPGKAATMTWDELDVSI